MDNNKLIAEFMGVHDEISLDSIAGNVHSWSDSPFFYTTEDSKEKVIENIAWYSKYHTSWDWLMPVVEKIESLGYVFTIQGGKAEYGEMVSRTRCFIVNDKLSSTHQAVVEFIKAYNHENRYICCSCGEHCSEYTYSEDRDSDECNDCKTYNDGQ